MKMMKSEDTYRYLGPSLIVSGYKCFGGYVLWTVFSFVDLIFLFWLRQFIDRSVRCKLSSTPPSTGLRRIQHLNVLLLILILIWHPQMWPYVVIKDSMWQGAYGLQIKKRVFPKREIKIKIKNGVLKHPQMLSRNIQRDTTMASKKKNECALNEKNNGRD